MLAFLVSGMRLLLLTVSHLDQADFSMEFANSICGIFVTDMYITC